jgi:tRNA(fMet)-specific endonuclease VapC
MTYLLDTNVWIRFLRKQNSAPVQRLRTHQPSEIHVCSVVAAELYHGCLRSNRPAANRTKVEAVLDPYVCLPFDKAAASAYARIRHELERLGTVIGPYDLQIGAIAIANNCTLVTHNIAEFNRIPGLVIEDWETP